jgi:FMN phosphatase YigB (HAD superfamily)
VKKIIVDIDNTLWDFAPVLHERIKRMSPDIPPPDEWVIWDFWKPYVSSQQLYTAIRDIHMEQDSYPVYPEAARFLASLKIMDFHITIASHREKGTLDATTHWLEKHSLRFDEVHLSHDKSVLFPNSWAVVDDSPVTLQKAAELGMVRAGLKAPWNRQDDHPLFDNLLEVLDYVKGSLP